MPITDADRALRKAQADWGRAQAAGDRAAMQAAAAAGQAARAAGATDAGVQSLHWQQAQADWGRAQAAGDRAAMATAAERGRLAQERGGTEAGLRAAWQAANAPAVAPLPPAGGGTPPAGATAGAGGSGAVNVGGTGQGVDIQGILSQISGIGGAGQYLQAMREHLAALPRWTPRAQEEIDQHARAHADRIVDPQVQAINRALADSRANVERQMETVEQRALRSAIARGGGRAGLTEWLTAEGMRPLMDALGRAERTGAEEIARLEGSRGQIAAQQAAELKRFDHAQAMGNWQMVNETATNLARLAQAAEAADRELAVELLPYAMQTANQRAQNWVDAATAVGRAPAAQGTQFVSLRDYAAGRGRQVTFDARTNEVVIGNRRYGADVIRAAGGRMEGGRWHLPQWWVDQQLGGM